MASAERRLNMAAMRDMTGMAILNFFSANSKFFRSDVKNAEHLGPEDERRRESRTLGVATACALGALYRFPAIYPLLFHLSLFCHRDTELKHEDLLPLEKLPVSNYIRMKISTSFYQMQAKGEGETWREKEFHLFVYFYVPFFRGYRCLPLSMCRMHANLKRRILERWILH